MLEACAQAELVRRGEVRPIDLVDAAIERIERIDDAVNAVVIRRFEQARREATGVLPDGPFRGVPILLKDHEPSAGDPWHDGCRAVKESGYVADADSYVVRRLRRAGFVILGKTNVPELCTWPSTEPVAYGPTRNPWDLEKSAGGSSGGSAAAVACGFTAVATGSDGGGSIRLPAGLCGVVGLKPSRGRVSSGPQHGHRWGGLSTDGVLARTTRDAAAVLEVIAGHETGDPYGVAGRHGFSPSAEDPQRRLRIGFCAKPPTGADIDEACADAARSVAAALAELGHEVEERWPAAYADVSYAARSRVIVAATVASDLRQWEEHIGRAIADEELEPVNAMYREWSRSMTAADYIDAETALHAFARRMTSWWEDDGHDVLVTPVLPMRTPPLGYFERPSRSGDWAGLFNYLSPFNITGQPVLAVPASLDPDGMPIGVQLVAAPGREDILVQLGQQLEAALGWPQRRPSIADV